MNVIDEQGQMKPTNILLPKSLMRGLDAQAQREGVQSRAAVIRRACAEYLQHHGLKNESNVTLQEAA